MQTLTSADLWQRFAPLAVYSKGIEGERRVLAVTPPERPVPYDVPAA